MLYPNILPPQMFTSSTSIPLRRAAASVWRLACPAVTFWMVLTLLSPKARGLDPGRALTQYATKHWNSEDGLPFDNILCLTQDRTGYLWLGTKEGLIRFDGARAQAFDGRTDPALGSYGIFSVLEDARSTDLMILANTNGIHYFIHGKAQATLPNAPAGQILLQDPADGALWIKTTRGLFQVALDGAVAGPLENASGWPVDAIHTICRDRSGQLWVGTDRGLYRQRSQGNAQWFDQLPVLAGKSVDHLIAARGGGLWLGSNDVGVGRLGGEGVFSPIPALADSTANVMLEDHAGTLWVGASGQGLCRITAGDSSRAEIYTVEEGLISNEVTSLCEDREGNLWIATPRGLQVLHDALFVNFGRSEGMTGEDVHAVFADERATLWVGHEEGLSTIDLVSGAVNNRPLAAVDRRPGNESVLCVGPGADKDSLLAGTRAGLLLWQRGLLRPFPVREDLDRSVVSALCLDAAGNHWIGTDNGLYQLRGSQVLAHLTTASGLENNHVGAFHLDAAGGLWIGTDGGLNRLDAAGQIAEVTCEQTRKSPGTVFAFYAKPGNADDFYVGTQEGLFRLRHAGGEPRLTRYTARDGALDCAITGITGDNQGNLWLSSSNGILRLDKAEVEQSDWTGSLLTCQIYGTADGLRSPASAWGSQPVSCRDPQGRLWFATSRGVAGVDPRRQGMLRPPPPVQVEELLADGRTEKIDGHRDAAISEELAAGTRKVGFRYTALSLANPEACRFRYRLDGFDAGWNEAGSERVAYYTNLPPGRYVFRVQTTRTDGVWTQVDASLEFNLRPFFYQTGWFWCSVTAGSLGVIWAIIYGWRQRWQGRLARTEADLRERTRHQAVLHQAKVEADLARAHAEQAKEQAEAARAAAEQANLAKSEFLSRISHELRTPLNAILGFGQLLELSDLSAGDRTSVGHLLKGGRHLLSLIDEVLDLARVESGNLNLVYSRVDLPSLTRECVQLVTRLAQPRRITCQVQMAGDLTVIWSNEQRLRQILINLLSNAIKYNREGGEVVLGGKLVSPDKLRIEISDTGLGISPEGLAKLFVPFERLDQAYGNVQGTGLGLVISRRLVEAMGGTLGVESQLGRGSTFWIELPTSARQAGASEEPLPLASVPAAAVPSGQQIRLLCVDDSVSNLKLIESLLERHRPGWKFSSAQDGRSGLEQAEKLLPDLILLDLQMPGMTGESVLNALRQNPVTRQIPVIMVSADATAQSRERLLAGGADGYVTKPFDLNLLVELVDRSCSRRT